VRARACMCGCVRARESMCGCERMLRAIVFLCVHVCARARASEGASACVSEGARV
jgi:hypothetical protein